MTKEQVKRVRKALAAAVLCWGGHGQGDWAYGSALIFNHEKALNEVLNVLRKRTQLYLSEL